MNAEQNSPESHAVMAAPPAEPTEGEGSASPSGVSPNTQGSSKNRRRRRKRKHRPAGETGTAPEIAAGAAAGAGDASAVAPATDVQSNSQLQPRNSPAQANGQGQQASGKRWKKKKFGRAGGDGQPRPEPGNSLQGSHSAQGRSRKHQQRGPRSFVGPMDHSYREANGNYADVPASTIEMHGGGRRQTNHRGHQHHEDRMPPELLSHHRTVVIPEDAPTHIYFFIEDLFFTAKIQEVARQQGVKVAFMKPDKDIVAHFAELHDHEHPSLIVFDLNNAAAKPLTLIPKLKNKLKKGTSIVGFLSHLQGDLKAKAVEAGCHSVMPRAAFSQNLPNLLRRYGVEDEHEPNFNQ